MILRAEQVSKDFSENIPKEFSKGTVRGLSYGRQGLRECSLTVDKGDYISIIGRSGCGKTTLLNIITGMLPPTTGQVYINDTDIYEQLKSDKRSELRNSKIGYLNYGNCLLENLTVYENILYPILLNGRKYYKNEINDMLEKLEIQHINKSYPWQISAGEYRRVCMGRVLALDTEMLVLDEPTSNLDDKSAGIIYQIIADLKRKKEIIIATHDKNLVMGKVIEL